MYLGVKVVLTMGLAVRFHNISIYTHLLNYRIYAWTLNLML